MGTNRLLNSLFLVALVCTVGACSPKQMWEGAAKTAMIMWNPSMPVGPPKDHPSVVNISLYAEPDVNVTDFGQAPVEVWIYQLSEEDQLMAADFDTLINKPKDALSTSYREMKTKQVKPGESAVIPDWEVDKKTRFIGVAVGYAAIDKATGSERVRHEIPLDEYKLMVALKKEGLVENADWERLYTTEFQGEDYAVYHQVPPDAEGGPIQWRAVERVNATGERYDIVIPIQARRVTVQAHR